MSFISNKIRSKHQSRSEYDSSYTWLKGCCGLSILILIYKQLYKHLHITTFSTLHLVIKTRLS